MTWLAENTLPIWMFGAVALTTAVIIYFQTRTSGGLLGMLGVILVTAALLITSWLIETPREAVEHSLYKLAATVEANDVQGTLRYLAPSANAQLRKDVETLMPLVEIDRARIIDTPEIELEDKPSPATATVKCRGVVLAIRKQDHNRGTVEAGRGGPGVRRGDRWLVESYTSQKNWTRALGH